MEKYKLNWRYKAFMCLLLLFVYPIVKVMIMQAGHKIVDENGAPLSTGWYIVSCIPIYLFGTLYMYVAFSFLFRLIKNHGAAFIITESGIESTFTFNILLAFILVGRVKCIPWSAVKSYELDDGVYSVKIDTSQIQASRLAKLHIRIFGYNFCAGFTAPLSDEDFRLYIEPHLTK